MTTMAKFWWGSCLKDELFDMNGMMVFLLISGLIQGGIMVAAGPEGTVDDYPTFESLYPVSLATVVMMWVMYLLLGNQVGVTFSGTSGKQFDMAKEVALRGVYNNMEHIVQFVVACWLHAIFVNPRTSAALMWAFVVCRYFYPILNGMYGQFNLGCEIVQQLHYSMIYYLFVSIVFKLTANKDFHSTVADVSPYLMFLVGVGMNIVCLISYLGFGKIGTTVILAGSKKAAEGYAEA